MQTLTSGILAKLDAESKDYAQEVAALTSRREIEEFTTEGKQIAFVYRVMQHCASQPLGKGIGPEVMIGHALSNQPKHDDALNGFRETFLEPFYEYIDDGLDQQAAVLSLLVKYRRTVKWFERDAIVAIAKDDERKLAKHLYAYLFEQGMEFHIEPQSASGEADLVAPELVLDAKVFDGERRGTSYIASGLHQVHTYARDFNQEVGYLIVYKTCPETLDFPFAAAGQIAPYVTAAGKTIYIFVIDICQHQVSASKRGPLKVYNIDEDFLVRALTEAPAASPGASETSSGTA
jgi:hypothetical protein